jgi:benzoyl-CoA reductase subunit BamC
MSSSTTKTVKSIKLNLDKCIGCRACEVACSGFHATPKYSSINPARSRIRIFVDELNDIYVPILAGYNTTTECSGRHVFSINGKKYSECSFCRSSCNSRDLFKEPDSGLPLKCDMCDGEESPMCVQVCRPGALTYMEREKEREEEPTLGEVETGLLTLVNRHGLQNVMDSVTRISKKS